VGDSGINSTPYVHLRTLSDTTDLAAQSEYVNVPVHNFVDDVTWTKGKHTLQFGTNLRLAQNNRSGNFQNVSYAVTDPFSLDTNAGIANEGSSPVPGISASLPLGFTVAPEVSNVIVSLFLGAFKRFMRDPKFYKFDLNVVLVTLHNFAPSGPPGDLLAVVVAGQNVFRHRRPFGRRE
jgi:hypothetical protein